MPPPDKDKRRPPPLPFAIPSTFSVPHQASRPQPVAAQDGNANEQEKRPHTRDGGKTPLHASFNPEIKSAGLGRSNSTSRFRETAVTTITDLMDRMRGEPSPKKSQHNSNQHELTRAPSNAQTASTSRSRRSERSYRTDLSAVGEENRTQRGEIERQNERKFFKMMGAVPDTPTDGSTFPDAMVSTTDLRTTRQSHGSETASKSIKEGVKSPKKKLFGITMPSFKSSSSNAAAPPPMPAKVAKVLGTSPAKKVTGTFLPPRSDTSKSLPSKVYNQNTYPSRSRRADIDGPSNTTSRSRVRRKSSPKTPRSSPAKRAGNAGDADDNGPTPPEKDTPERVAKWLNRGLLSTTNQDNKKLAMHLPTMKKLDPTFNGSSPAKFRKNYAKDFAQLEEVEPIMSAYGVVEQADTEASTLYTETEDEESLLLHTNHGASLECQPDMTPIQGDPRKDQGSIHPVSLLTARRSSLTSLEFLPATVYVPPSRVDKGEGSLPEKADKNPLISANAQKQSHPSEKINRGSIGIVFRGNANEINSPSSRGGMGQTIAENNNSQPPKLDENGVPQQAIRFGAAPQSSTRLSDMLGGVSPNKTGFNDFHPSCPSAVPSPLRQGPLPPQVSEYPPRQRPSMSMDDHFFVTNEHIDVVACSLWDKIAMQATQQTEETSAKYEKLMTLMGKQFEEIKAHIGSVNDKADHGAHQYHNLGLQLDKVHELIKKEIIGTMDAQSLKMRDMEHNIIDLQKVIQELQKIVERNNAGCLAAQSGGSGTFPLQNHRAQPSMPVYYDNSGRDSMELQQQMAVQQQTPGHSDGSRSGGNSYLSRSGYAGRETKDSDNPFTRTNPYYTPSAQAGNGYTQAGGFGPYGYSPSPGHQQFPPHYGSTGSAK